MRDGSAGCPREGTLSGERVERRLAAILAADAAGYSRLMGQDEAGTLARLKALRRDLIDPKISEHKGRIFKTTGDGLLIEFPSVVEAVACAVEVQREMIERNTATPEDQRIEFRVGIHQGDIIVEGDDIFGDGVNVAARLEALAEPGGICVSARVQEDAAGKLDLTFADCGEQVLKNIARPVRAYRVTLDRPASFAPAALPLPDKPSLVVLPFQNMTGDAEQEYFADGMVEEITTAIARLPWLFVIARNSSFTFKGRAVDVKQVARELGVRYVLEGSVRKAGNRVRITGQLIDTATGAHIWAERFDSALEDIFDLQDRVASSVAGAIEPKLRQSEIERATRKPTENLDAYDLYLRALTLRDRHTDESVAEAIALLKRALTIDGNYAPAKALIGWSHIHQMSHGRTPISEVDRAEAVAFAREALEAGKDDPDTLWMAGYTLLIFAGERAVAATAIDRALTLNPNSARGWMAHGYICLSDRQYQSAIEAFERAIRLSPFDSLRRAFITGTGIAHFRMARYEEALTWAERTLSEEPGYRGALLSKTVALVQLNRMEEAADTLRRMVDSQPGLTIARYKALWANSVPPEVLALNIEALRKAGLPEG